MAVFNSQKVIHSTLESLKNQTFSDWECIICDDGSTDNTLEIVRDFIKQTGSRFTVISNQKNRGPAFSRNRCIEVASGEYIAIQDADDISLPDRFTKQVEFLDANRDVSVVGTYAFLINAKGENWGIIKPPLIPTKKDWIKGTQVIHASTMIRKRALLDIGKYNEKLRRTEDYELWLRMILKGYKIATIPEILYKIHWDEASYKRRKFQYRWNEAIIIYHAIKGMNVPFLYYLYLFKPLINGLIPKKLVYLYHKRKFIKQTS